jgi:TonB family protein
MSEPPPLTTDKLKFKVVDPVTATAQAMEEGSKVTRPAPESITKLTAPAPMRKRHPHTLKAILADPSATEDEWLAAAHEIELHGGITKLDDGPLVQRARRRRRALVFATAVLAVGSGLVIAYQQSTPVTVTVNPGPPMPAAPDFAPTPPLPPVAAARTDVDFGPYMANVQRQIKREWFPPKSDESTKVKVLFKVCKDGSMAKLKILNHGPDQATDNAALLAVENAAPSFHALPEGAPADVDIEFTFDYHVTPKQPRAL